jgi:hypothetical protein
MAMTNPISVVRTETPATAAEVMADGHHHVWQPTQSSITKERKKRSNVACEQQVTSQSLKVRSPRTIE